MSDAPVRRRTLKNVQQGTRRATKTIPAPIPVCLAAVLITWRGSKTVVVQTILTTKEGKGDDLTTKDASHRDELTMKVADHRDDLTTKDAGHRDDMTAKDADHRDDLTTTDAGHRDDLTAKDG